MSGVEVAGLVLACLPLVISALEHYARGARTVRAWGKYRLEVIGLRHILNTEFEIFRNTCEIMLARIASPKGISTLLDDPGGCAWKDPRLDIELRRILRRSYDGYIETMQNINSAVAEFQHKLRLGTDGSVQCDQDGSLRRFLRALRFSLEKDAFDALVQRIKTHNNTLKLLTDTSLTLEVSRKKRRATQAPNFELFRDCARSVHEAITASLRCSCGDTHRAGLRLEPRTKGGMLLIEDGFAASHIQVQFGVLLSYADAGAAVNETPWTYREVELHTTLPHDASKPIGQSETGRTTRMAVGAHQPRRAVRFASLETQARPSTIENLKLPDLIEDLCATCSTLGPSRVFGLLGPKTAPNSRVLCHLSPSHDSDRSWSTVTLDKVILGSKTTKRRLSGLDRRRLAVTLSSTVLQLFSTPWLEIELQRKEISFLQREEDTPFDELYLFINTCRQPPAKSGTELLTGHVIRNRTMFSLGILLIELCLSRAIEWGDARDFDSLISEVSEEYGIEYGNAIRRCVWCDFDYHNTDLAQPGFCAVVYKSVVSILAEDLKMFTMGFKGENDVNQIGTSNQSQDWELRVSSAQDNQLMQLFNDVLKGFLD